MKTATALFIAGLMIVPNLGLTQTLDTQVAPIQPTATVAAPQPAADSLTPIKCGVNSFGVSDECGIGVYKTVHVQCYDGYEPVIGDTSSCKSSEIWSQYAKESCANHCSTGYIPKPLPTPATPAIPATPNVSPATPATPIIFPPTTAVSLSPIKCGVNTFMVYNECGLGAYKNVYAQCYDNYETNLGAVESSCKSAETWDQYAKEACANHCSTGKESYVITKPLPQPTLPAPAPTTYGGNGGGGSGGAGLITSPTPKPISVCYISDDLMQQYNQLIAESQKSGSDKTVAAEITQQMIALKQEIAVQQNECVHNSSQPAPTTVSGSAPTLAPIATENKPIAVSIDPCNEIAQWATKVAYYKKISGLNDTDLKKSGFSREEIEKILQELSLGIEKVKAQCASQSGTTTAPSTAITGSASLAETVRPVVVESGQEIGVYYKARIEKALSTKGEEKQVAELKALRGEIDGLISNLIKSRTELEAGELNTLVKEVKISQGKIKADDIVVSTTDKKILVNMGDRPVSVEPTVKQVLIRDKGLEVNTAEVMIKENVLSVGGVDVKMSASAVAEKLGLAPTTVELKEENAKAVYNMKINERRKLFGFIPFNRERIMTVDAENGNTISENIPWYNFMTTK